jgi:ubiquinone/menaquinone biosynthesis C-methylase UbiE
MERLEAEYFEKPNISLLEHRHRYLWASAFARGVVCDIACGAGYGAEFLMASKEVVAYLGMDVSDDALSEASKRYRGPGIHFAKASATDMPIEDASVDTVISMETLEHLQDPAAAVREFRRVLRRGEM